MGTTSFTLHVYSNEPVDPALGNFFSLSEGWQTMILDPAQQDLEPCARKLSKKIPAPVLAFYIYDSEEVFFSIFEKGKRCVLFCSSSFPVNQGIFKIPGLVGYPDGYKRRISEILSCPDIEQLTALLEEFFGVALVVYNDTLEEDPESLIRFRGETQYLAFHEGKKKQSGKQSPIRAILTEEIRGKLFQSYFGEPMMVCEPGYFLFGYDAEERGDDLRFVHFTNGRLAETEGKLVQEPPYDESPRNKRFIYEHGVQTKVTFGPDTPEAYRGKTLAMPAGLYAFDFDSKGRLLLSGQRNNIAYMSPEGKITAKLSFKGDPILLDGDYLLTAGSESFYAYCYNPNQYIRIYRLEDKE